MFKRNETESQPKRILSADDRFDRLLEAIKSGSKVYGGGSMNKVGALVDSALSRLTLGMAPNLEGIDVIEYIESIDPRDLNREFDLSYNAQALLETDSPTLTLFDAVFKLFKKSGVDAHTRYKDIFTALFKAGVKPNCSNIFTVFDHINLKDQSLFTTWLQTRPQYGFFNDTNTSILKTIIDDTVLKDDDKFRIISDLFSSRFEITILRASSQRQAFNILDHIIELKKLNKVSEDLLMLILSTLFAKQNLIPSLECCFGLRMKSGRELFYDLVKIDAEIAKTSDNPRQQNEDLDSTSWIKSSPTQNNELEMQNMERILDGIQFIRDRIPEEHRHLWYQKLILAEKQNINLFLYFDVQFYEANPALKNEFSRTLGWEHKDFASHLSRRKQAVDFENAAISSIQSCHTMLAQVSNLLNLETASKNAELRLNNAKTYKEQLDAIQLQNSVAFNHAENKKSAEAVLQERNDESIRAEQVYRANFSELLKTLAVPYGIEQYKALAPKLFQSPSINTRITSYNAVKQEVEAHIMSSNTQRHREWPNLTLEDKIGILYAHSKNSNAVWNIIKSGIDLSNTKGDAFQRFIGNSETNFRSPVALMIYLLERPIKPEITFSEEFHKSLIGHTIRILEDAESSRSAQKQ